MSQEWMSEFDKEFSVKINHLDEEVAYIGKYDDTVVIPVKGIKSFISKAIERAEIDARINEIIDSPFLDRFYFEDRLEELNAQLKELKDK